MSETMGRCRKQIEESYAHNRNCVPRYAWITADALDRLAADVAAIKAKVDDIVPGDTGRFVPSELEWSELVDRKTAAIRERDEARAEVNQQRLEGRRWRHADRCERLKAKLGEQQP